MGNETSKPELRHEFIAMAFALAVGEIGLQLASLVKEGQPLHFLPAYTHLLLATTVIAASFVGWSQSPSPGGRRDVRKVLEWEFVVLLFDMALVIIYFLLVRAVDFEKAEGSNRHEYHASAAPENGWLIAIFAVYLVWDILAKFIVKERTKKIPRKNRILRTVPTVLCLLLSIASFHVFRALKAASVPVADVALIALVLLFRALKDFVSAFWPDPVEEPSTEGMHRREIERATKQFEALKLRRNKDANLAKCPAIIWSVCLFVLIVAGMLWCRNGWRLPTSVENEMNRMEPPQLDLTVKSAG